MEVIYNVDQTLIEPVVPIDISAKQRVYEIIYMIGSEFTPWQANSPNALNILKGKIGETPVIGLDFLVHPRNRTNYKLPIALELLAGLLMVNASLWARSKHHLTTTDQDIDDTILENPIFEGMRRFILPHFSFTT